MNQTPRCVEDHLKSPVNDQVRLGSTEIGRVTSGDGISMPFERVGAGPAVILVGAAGNFRGFSPMPELADALAPDFTVVTYDSRGKGAGTDTLPYAVDRAIGDLHALIDLAGGSAHLHGSSSEAILALLAAEPGHRRPQAVPARTRRCGSKTRCLRRPPAPTTASAPALCPRPAGRHQHPGPRSCQRREREPLRNWARGVARALPNASALCLPGTWHGVAADLLAAVLAEFITGREATQPAAVPAGCSRRRPGGLLPAPASGDTRSQISAARSAGPPSEGPRRAQEQTNRLRAASTKEPLLMILIELIFDAPPDAHGNVAELARRTTAATHRENGCILYRFTTDLDRPSRFILTELWESEEHLKAHLRRRSIQELLGRTAPGR